MGGSNILNDWKMVILMCLTLGLAPFFPEPHLVGKIRWIAGGANGMAFMDWLDFLWHLLPWLLLIRLIVIKLKRPTLAN
ncbi:MAG: hypothetical protein NWR73_10395 [Flavobacteriales bacterium]|jgi:hypothetical protein|nr:hypothetical protein [Flavobacteriales bacterium]